MKKILTMSLLIVFWLSSITAQELKTKDTPDPVCSRFFAIYPDAKEVKWTKEDALYEADFTTDKHDMAVLMNSEGGILRKTFFIKIEELPQNVQDYLIQNYRGIKFATVSEVKDVDGVVHYEAEVKNKIVSFDAKGHFRKEEYVSD